MYARNSSLLSTDFPLSALLKTAWTYQRSLNSPGRGAPADLLRMPGMVGSLLSGMEEYSWQSCPHSLKAEDWLRERSFLLGSGMASHVPSLRTRASIRSTGLHTPSLFMLILSLYLVKTCFTPQRMVAPSEMESSLNCCLIGIQLVTDLPGGKEIEVGLTVTDTTVSSAPFSLHSRLRKFLTGNFALMTPPPTSRL